MPFGRCWIGRRVLFGFAAALALGAASAQATPYLVVDADSDQVLMENEATAPWYPASLTKLMTVYVALDAVRSGKLTLDTPLIMSARAARMPPSKMGFRPGTEVTLDNALKMLMVKSPNDVAVMVAEGVSGSVEAFADDMNADAQRLGLHESHFVNPNGLHNPDHVSSARDMAIIARALLREFPDHADLFSIGAIELGNRYIPNHNGLLGRYPGADGMKTGFTCPAGFNVVASANHYGRRLIVVVLGRADGENRATKRRRTCSTAASPAAGASARWNRCPRARAPAPNMRADVCLHRNAAALAAAEDDGARRPGSGGISGRRWDAPHPFGGAFCPSRRAHRAYQRKDPLRSGARLHRSGAGLEGAGAGRAPDDNRNRGRAGRAKTISADNASAAATASEGDASGAHPDFAQIQAQAGAAFREKDGGAQTREERARKIGEEGRIHQLNLRSPARNAKLMH